MREKEEKSIWLRTDAFKASLRAWPECSKWIPIDGCELQKKFKVKTRVFSLEGTDSIQSNPKKLQKLDKRIDENAENGTLNDRLEHGMCLFLFSFSSKSV